MPTVQGNGNGLNVNMPSVSGAYVLLLSKAAPETIVIGKRGRFFFPEGFYAYIGSAFGPGGLCARVNRHLSKNKRLHWHIDYLLKRTRIREIWAGENHVKREHEWAKIWANSPDATVAVSGFGSGDCRCPAHLFHFFKYPQMNTFKRILAEKFPRDPEIKRIY